jgi:hypothetical protein
MSRLKESVVYDRASWKQNLMGDRLSLTSVAVEISLADLYENIEFGE